MKAVIMAGGKGTRLQPLTWHLPKPMVPLLDRPCMEYIIDLLKRHGITEIGVTLQYLPQAIKNHFGDGSEYGVHLHYFEETTPLGTAGSVKNAEEFLDGTFVVVSGDALTDFNLEQAIQFHREKQAVATLVLTTVEVPIEYGVVTTNDDGRIVRFQEKPSWSEVFSNTVNTGIYVLEPDVLKLFDKGQIFDFSKDLFPMLMHRDLPVYGYVADGYWSDVGSLVQYRQSQFDMLNGLVDVEIKGREVSQGIWVGEGVDIHPSAQINGPVFIGDGCTIASGATLKPYAVTGRYSRVHREATVERSIVWNRVSVGASASLEGVTVCSGVQIGRSSRIHENAVIGTDSRIGEKAIIHPNVKVWPNKNIETETIQRTSLIWGKTSSSRLFEDNKISGVPNLELTPEFVGRITAAYGSCLPRGATVSVSCDDEPYSEIMKYSVISSLLAAGVHVRDLGAMVTPMARYACKISHDEGGVYISTSRGPTSDRLQIHLFNCDGLPIDKATERKIENAYFQEDFARPNARSLGTLGHAPSVFRSYIDGILSCVDSEVVRQRKLQVVYGCDSPGAMLFMHALLERLGCTGIMLLQSEGTLERTVVSTKSDLGLYVEGNGASFLLVTDKGYSLAKNVLETSRFMNRVEEESWRTADARIPRPLNRAFDAFYSITQLLHYLASHEESLHRMMEVVFPISSVAEVASTS